MRLSASVMTEVPFAGNLAIALVSFVIIGSLIVAVFVVRDILKERRNSQLQAVKPTLRLNHFKHLETTQKPADNEQTLVDALPSQRPAAV